MARNKRANERECKLTFPGDETETIETEIDAEHVTIDAGEAGRVTVSQDEFARIAVFVKQFAARNAVDHRREATHAD